MNRQMYRAMWDVRTPATWLGRKLRKLLLALFILILLLPWMMAGWDLYVEQVRGIVG